MPDDPKTAPPDRTPFADARAHLQAATALLMDPTVPVPLGVGHLAHAWTALARAAVAIDGGDADADIDDPLATLRAHAPAWLGLGGAGDDVGKAAAPWPLPADEATETDRAKWLGQARNLAKAVGAAQQQLFGDSLAADSRRRWWRRLAMAAVAVAPLVVWTILFPPDFREGPWRGEYYDNVEFEGEPTEVRRDADIKFK